MKILAADTSTSVLSVAVSEDGRLLAETVVDCGRAHAERLLATTEWVLAEAGLTLDAIDLLAISNGPGSFTGLRVGVAAWKGLALARNLPLMGVPTLDAMTRLAGLQNGVLCPLLDARMKEVYGAVFRFDQGNRTKCTPDLVCPVERILESIEGRPLLLGDGVAAYHERIVACRPDAVLLPAGMGLPRASCVAEEAAARMAAGACADAALVNPVYLRKSQPEMKGAAPVVAPSGHV